MCGICNDDVCQHATMSLDRTMFTYQWKSIVWMKEACGVVHKLVENWFFEQQMYNILHYIMGPHDTFIDICNHNRWMFNGLMGCVHMQWERPTIDGS